MLSRSIESSLAASDLLASSTSARSSAFTFHSSIKISSSCTSSEPVDGLLVLRNLVVQRFDLLLRLESMSVYLYQKTIRKSLFVLLLSTSRSWT